MRRRPLRPPERHQQQPPPAPAPPSSSSSSVGRSVRGAPGEACSGSSAALRRLLGGSRSPARLLRWLSQNPRLASPALLALALARLACLLCLPPAEEKEKKGEPPPARPPAPALLLAQPDFRFLSRGLAGHCARLDPAGLLGCLVASALLGLPTDSPLVQALEKEAQQRQLDHPNLRDAAPGASSCPQDPAGRTDHLEKERHPRGRGKGQQESARPKGPKTPLPVARGGSGQPGAPLWEEELALVEEMLALSAPEAGGSDKALAAVFRSRLFSEDRQEHFVRRMAEWFPGKAEGLTPSTVALVAKHLARHRLHEPRLLDAVAAFLLRRVERLDGQMIQRLIFPFGRLNYRPPNHAELFPRLAGALGQKASLPPLATLNVLLSLCQLQFCPPATLLRRVFSPAFLADVTSSPCGQIARRYLSLLDAAVVLENPGYDGPRLDPRYRVRMFDGALTADRANRKYSYKGLVGEGLRRLVGPDCYRQDEVVPPGYGVDFLLRVSSSGQVLPLGGDPHASTAAATITAVIGTPVSEVQNASPLRLEGPTAEDIRPGSSRHPGTAPVSSPSRTETALGSRSCGSTSNAACLRFRTQGATVQHKPEKGLGQSVTEALAEPPISPDFPSAEGTRQNGPRKAEDIHRLVLSVNDKWHYCQNSEVLVGSRAMRNRHLCLLGYHLLQLPYWELERLCGLEEAQQYLCQKLKELQF